MKNKINCVNLIYSHLPQAFSQFFMQVSLHLSQLPLVSSSHGASLSHLMHSTKHAFLQSEQQSLQIIVHFSLCSIGFSFY